MRSLNNKSVKQNVKKQVSIDKYDLPIAILKNLKFDILECFLKYTNINKDDIVMNVSVLKNNKFYVEISCFIDDFFYSKGNY